MLPDTKTFQTIINGIKSQAGKNLKIINLLKTPYRNVDVILTYEDYIEKALKMQKPVFAVVKCKNIKESSYFKNPNLKKVFLTHVPIDMEIKILKKIFKDIKKFSVVIYDERKLKCFKKIKDLRIFKVNNIGEVPYAINKAFEISDILIAIPDEKVFNYFSTQFILRKAIMMRKKVVAYSEEFLKLGAYIAVIPDYFQEGVKISKDILNFIKSGKAGKKLYIPQNIKIVKNKNLM